MKPRSQTRLLWAFIAFASIAACPSSAAGEVSRGHNVLLILADDIGLPSLKAYAYLNLTAPPLNPTRQWVNTPVLDQLAADGMVFSNLWSNATCSPTRATILTGRYGFRTGVLAPASHRANLVRLHADELTLPQVFRNELVDIESAGFGKWHLANCLNGREHHPNMAGFSHFAGTMANPDTPFYYEGDNLAIDSPDYFSWIEIENGTTTEIHDNYLTTETVNDAISFIDGQTGQNGAWFVYLAFHAAHTPLHLPAEDLLPGCELDLPSDASYCNSNPSECFDWMIAAMDCEIGRLLGHVDLATTTVIFLADNGAISGYAAGSPYPFGHNKGSLYQGGVNVPLIVGGSAVRNRGAKSDVLVNTTDLFDTVIELISGRDVEQVLPGNPTPDSFSLLPILQGTGPTGREFVFSETGGKAAIRRAQYKLIRKKGTDEEELYDLSGDDRYTEFENLLDPSGPHGTAAAAHDWLKDKLDELLEPTVSACPVNQADCRDCCTNTPGEECSISSETAPGDLFEVCADAPQIDGEKWDCFVTDLQRASCREKDGVSKFDCIVPNETVHSLQCDCAGRLGHCDFPLDPYPKQAAVRQALSLDCRLPCGMSAAPACGGGCLVKEEVCIDNGSGSCVCSPRCETLQKTNPLGCGIGRCPNGGVCEEPATLTDKLCVCGSS